ncbi:8-amino-7-oxononanoate synthase [soil metagenome]
MPQAQVSQTGPMQSLDAFAAATLASLEARHLKRTIETTHRLDGLWVERGGRRLLSFSCNDYLSLSHHPAVKAAAKMAIDAYGAGAGASRLVTGDHPLIARLEARLAALKGCEAACIFGSGYMTNAGVIPTFVEGGDIILVDALAHACIWAGAKLSGATVKTYAHNDLAHLAALLSEPREPNARVMVATEGVFSMDGDLAPLDEISALCQAHDAWLLNDDAHGLGVVGEGRGSVAAFADADVPLQMGTLSKALGSFGGYVCGSGLVIDLIKTRARTLVYATGLPPASAGAALAALDIIEAEPERVATPLAKARLFARAANLPEPASAIVPVILREAGPALAASKALEAQGFLVTAIRPPTVPEGTARLRLAFTAGHPDAEVERLARAVKALA